MLRHLHSKHKYTMKHIFLAQELADDTANHTHPYYEFLNHAALSAGIYKLQSGRPDLQNPHSEDEIYYVLEGQSKMVIGSSSHSISQGDIIYVPAFEEHRFYDIQEDLKLLVFFSNAPISKFK